MFGITVLLVLATLSSVEPALVWKDCTTDTSNQMVKVTDIQASPLPLTSPGHLTLTIKAMILAPITPGSLLNMTFEKKLLGQYTHVPCVAGLGSCSIVTCSILNSTQTSTDGAISALGSAVFKMFKDSGAHIDYCPVPVQTITITDYTINLPDISGSALLSTFGIGDYRVTLKFVQPVTNQVRGCVQFAGGLRVPGHSFLFG